MCQFPMLLGKTDTYLDLDAGLLIGEFLKGTSARFKTESRAHHLGQDRMRRSREDFDVRHSLLFVWLSGQRRILDKTRDLDVLRGMGAG